MCAREICLSNLYISTSSFILEDALGIHTKIWIHKESATGPVLVRPCLNPTLHPDVKLLIAAISLFSCYFGTHQRLVGLL